MVSEYQALQAICRQSFAAFTAKAFQILHPGIPLDWSWHLDCNAAHLEALHRGEIQRLMTNQPPRTLKSEQYAQIYPAWVLGHEPWHQFIGASYAHSLAERNVMGCRRIIESEWYHDLFPAVILSKDQNTKDYFMTTMGGAYKGTGIGGTITGFGADTLLLDDVLNPKEA